MRGAVVGSIVAFALVGVGAKRVAPPEVGDNWLVQVSVIKQDLGGRTNDSKAAEQCYDTAGSAAGNKGYTCSNYEHSPNDCPHSNYYDDDDFTALHMCCVCGGGDAAPQAPTPAPTLGQTFGADDPHLVGVSGDKFDVNQPGGYTLLRVPADRTLPAKLEVNASLKANSSSPCGLYIKEIQLSGAWFEGLVVRVWPLQRDMPGNNGAGNKTLRPFSLQVDGGWHGTTVNHSEPWAKEFTKHFSERVHVKSLWRQPYAESGRVMEAEAFQFFIRGWSAQAATVDVSQASHQALDIQAAGLWGLGFKQLGGLLGTEGHDKKIEHVTSECAAFQKMIKNSNVLRTNQPSSDERKGSTMGAYWGNA